AEQAERPPHPRRGEHAGAVIDHDGVGLRDAECADIAAELLSARQHVGKWIGMVRDRIEVEADRTRNVAGKELSRSVALLRRKIERAVDWNEIGAAELRGEPVGSDDPAA